MIPKHAHKCIIEEAPTAGGTKVETFSIHSGSVMVSVFARTVDASLQVTIYTYGDNEDEDLEIITFPALSAPTTNMLLKKSSLTLNKIKVVVTYTGACDYTILARGIESADSTVSIAGANSASASQKDVGVTALELIPASLLDRKGLILRNNSETAIVYIGYTEAEATIANGFPLYAKDAIPVDVEAGVDVWAISTEAATDIRIMEAGN